MYYLVIHLREEKYLEDVMLALAQAGIFNACVFEGLAMQKILNRVPVFSGVRFSNLGGGNYVHGIFALIEEKEAVDVFLDGLSASGVDFHENRLGVLALIPIERAIVSKPEMEI